MPNQCATGPSSGLRSKGKGTGKPASQSLATVAALVLAAAVAALASTA